MAELRKLIDADIAIKRFSELKFKGEMQDYDDEIRMVFESVIETTPTVTEAEIRAKAIDEIVEEAMKQFTDFDLKHGYPTVTDCKIILRDVAEWLKEE